MPDKTLGEIALLAHTEAEGYLPSDRWEAAANAVAEECRKIAAAESKWPEWRPMKTAPRGSEDIDDTSHPDYIKPPKILLRFGDEDISVAYWDWYYAEGGYGCTDGFAWISSPGGEPLNLIFSAEPDGWLPLPSILRSS